MKHQPIKPVEDIMSRRFGLALAVSLLLGLVIWIGVFLLLF